MHNFHFADVKKSIPPLTTLVRILLILTMSITSVKMLGSSNNRQFKIFNLNKLSRRVLFTIAVHTTAAALLKHNYYGIPLSICGYQGTLWPTLPLNIITIDEETLASSLSKATKAGNISFSYHLWLLVKISNSWIAHMTYSLCHTVGKTNYDAKIIIFSCKTNGNSPSHIALSVNINR